MAEGRQRPVQGHDDPLHLGGDAADDRRQPDRQGEFTALTGINVEIEIVPLEQVLQKATLDVQGQLGTYDLYYLDQSWMATFAQDTVDPFEKYQSNKELAMPGFNWDDFSKPLVDGISMYDGKMVGIPFDIPIFILMYRKDLFDKHGITVPTTMDEYMAAVKAIDAAERGNGIYGTTGQLKSGHYSLNCDWTAWLWSHGGSIFDKNQMFSGGDADGIAGPRIHARAGRAHAARRQDLDLGRRGPVGEPGHGRHADLLGRVLPGLRRQGQQGRGPDGGGAPAQGEEAALARRCRLRRDPAHRPPGRLGPGASRPTPRTRTRPGSSCSGSARPTSWRGSRLLGGGASPMRLSSFKDPRVLAAAKVGPGTTRHFPAIEWTINNAMGSEPDMPAWAEISNNVIPVELGKLLAGQYGSPQECMDAIKGKADELAAPFRKA